MIFVGEVGEPVFDEALHRYTFSGRPVPSVTQVMRPLTDVAYGQIAPSVLKAAADFGTAVHACTEYFDQGDLDEETVAPEWRPYLDAYVAWKETMRPTIERIEWRLACSKYAGTIDRVATIAGDRWVIDLKTTSQIHPHVGVQLAAYEALAYAASGGEGPRFQRAALQLREDGTFKFTKFEAPTDAVCFSALLGIHNWRQKHEK